MDRPNVLVATVVVALHAYSMWVFGATFWYDSAVYFQFGSNLFHNDLRAFYDGPRYYIYQHVMPGFPLLLGGLTLLFDRYGWVALATLQHSVAAISLLYLLRTLKHFLSPMWQLTAAVLICLHPYYMAFHNSPLTESLSSSALLVLIAAGMRIAQQSNAGTALLLFATAGALGVQLRSYNAAYVLPCLAILILVCTEYRRRWVIAGVGLIVVGSLLVFPIYRWVRMGVFFLPNTDYLALPHALNINPHVSEPTLRMLERMPLPQGQSAQRIASQGLSYPIAAELGARLKSVGYSDAEARQAVKRIAWAIRTDSAAVLANQLRYGLLSVGCPNLALLGTRDSEFLRGYTLGEYRDHVQYYLSWFAWTKFDNYLPVFDQYLAIFEKNSITIDQVARNGLERFLRPFFVTRGPNLRDPLRHMSVPLEVWVFGWLAGIIIIVRRQQAGAALIVVAPMVSYFASLQVPIGDVRYAQPLIPLYIIMTTVLLSALASSTHVVRLLESCRWVVRKKPTW